MDVSRALPVPGLVLEHPGLEVIWHELECGSYSADLPLWHELAARYGGPVLDVGAGSGRVALELARAGHSVTALDRSSELLAALGRRAVGLELELELVSADARAFALPRSDYALCIVPMQTVQLLGGRAGRIEFLRHARAHLRTDGILACAILSAVDPFDCSDGGPGPDGERTTLDGRLFMSRAIRVAETPSSVVIERERQVLPALFPPPQQRSFEQDEHDAGSIECDVIELDRVTAAMVHEEAAVVGLRAEPTREIAATDEHVGSSVVMLRA